MLRLAVMDEGEKRKPDETDIVSGESQKKPRADVKKEAPAEGEVEEFFATLRRIHSAIKYFERGGSGDGRPLAGGGSALRQAIERDCGAETVGGVKEKEKEKEKEKAGFDLNESPDPDVI